MQQAVRLFCATLITPYNVETLYWLVDHKNKFQYARLSTCSHDIAASAVLTWPADLWRTLLTFSVVRQTVSATSRPTVPRHFRRWNASYVAHQHDSFALLSRHIIAGQLINNVSWNWKTNNQSICRAIKVIKANNHQQ